MLCTQCGKSFRSANGLKWHVKNHEKEKSPSGAIGKSGPVRDALQGGQTPEPFYPAFEQWTDSGGASGPSAGAPLPPRPAVTVPILSAEAIVALCDAVDGIAEKVLGKKIYTMSRERAKVVEAALSALPVQVTQPLAPILVPWYVPVLTIVAPILILPAVLALAQWSMAKMKERRERREERGPSSQEPEDDRRSAQSAAPSVVFDAQPWREPTSG